MSNIVEQRNRGAWQMADAIGSLGRSRARHPRQRMKLSLGFSPCPNDCFMFDAIVNRRIDLEGLEFSVRMADVEALNKAAFAGDADVTKLSYHAYAYCADQLRAARRRQRAGQELRAAADFEAARSRRKKWPPGQLRIAIPGRYTTANFLLGLAFPDARDKTELVFSEIEPALSERRIRRRADHPREPVHLRSQGTEEDRRSRRVLGSGNRRADSARRHRHQAVAARRGQAAGESRAAPQRGVRLRPSRRRACRSCASTRRR